MTNPSASNEGSFTCDESTIRMDPASSMPSGSQSGPGRHEMGLSRAESMPRSANSAPASINPSISASLWMPATKCMISSGFAAPSHSALTSATPQRRASRGVAHTISMTPARTTNRWQSTAATMFCLVSSEMPRPIHKNNGP